MRRSYNPPRRSSRSRMRAHLPATRCGSWLCRRTSQALLVDSRWCRAGRILAASPTSTVTNMQALHEIFSGRQISTDPLTLRTWGGDWTKSFEVNPSAVVFPETTEQIVALVNYANDARMALVPSGGRTGLSGGAVAGSGEVVVSFDRMNKIVSFEPADRLVRCQAG